MKRTRSAVLSLSLATFLLSAPMLWGQDLSKYRDFSLGMSLGDLTKQIGAKPADATVVHEHPALIQELTWWPRRVGNPPQPEAVRQVLFSFCDGKLYRIYVTYDDAATEGMTADDMARAVSARYGTSTKPDTRISVPATGTYGSTEKVMDRWEDAQYSVNLLQPSFSSTFTLALLSKQLNADAEAATAAAVKLELQNAPQDAIDRKKKETAGLEVSRAKNVQVFHP